MPGEVSWTDEYGVTHDDDSESGSVLFTRCGQSIVGMVNVQRWDSPAKPITCLFCLVGDTHTVQLNATIKLIEARGIKLDEDALDKLIRGLDA